MTNSDELLPSIQAGDATAFGRWMSVAEPRIRLSLRSYATAVDTEAVVQEALLRTWQVAPQCKPDGKPDSLLRLSVRIARNLANSEARRHRPCDMPAEPDDDPWQEQPVEPDPMLRRAIGECMEKLPSKPSRALSLRLQNAGADPDTTLARRAGMTLNTFLQNFTRARRLLQQCLQSRGIDMETVMS